jgi:hypothetical protein
MNNFASSFIHSSIIYSKEKYDFTQGKNLFGNCRIQPNESTNSLQNKNLVPLSFYRSKKIENLNLIPREDPGSQIPEQFDLSFEDFHFSSFKTDQKDIVDSNRDNEDDMKPEFEQKKKEFRHDKFLKCSFKMHQSYQSIKPKPSNQIIEDFDQIIVDSILHCNSLNDLSNEASAEQSDESFHQKDIIQNNSFISQNPLDSSFNDQGQIPSFEIDPEVICTLFDIQNEPLESFQFLSSNISPQDSSANYKEKFKAN